jgi:hypothetical protein
MAWQAWRTWIARCAAIALAALVAPACTPHAQLATDLLWISTFEGGDFREWSDPGGGGPTPQGAPTVVGTSTEQAHRGRYAAKLTIVPTTPDVQGLASLMRKSGLPAEAYYSAWYYVPSPVTVDKFWTIFKLRVRAVADDVATEAELYDANIRSQPSGELRFWIYDHRIAGQIPQQTSEPVVPVGQWFHVEAFYRNAQDNTGRATFWFNGQLVADVDGVAMGPTPWVEWDAVNIGANLSPIPVTIYVDDAAISRSRVGPDGILED